MTKPSKLLELSVYSFDLACEEVLKLEQEYDILKTIVENYKQRIEDTFCEGCYSANPGITDEEIMRLWGQSDARK